MGKDSNSARGVALWLFVVLVLLLIILGGITLIQKRGGNTEKIRISSAENVTEAAVTAAPTEAASEPPVTTTVRTFDFDDAEINSETALLTDLEGNELFSQNQYEKIYPASLTKIMTAIVAIENVYDIDEKIVITGDIYDQVTAENGSTAGFLAYEEVSYRDLLYGAILSSGAECCLTLANYIAGSEWNYVGMMNDKAEELGMNDTHFTNVCGFQDYDHYSTAADISLLLRYALEDDTFYEIFTSQSYYTETDERPEGVTLSSTMFSEMDSSYIEGGRILGGKTGFTDEAGLCLASVAEIDGTLYTLVTTGAPGTHYTEPLHIYDAVKLYEMLG
ncbi:MAG: serine hydrolase [Clostridium sp.]|nr:serine hydrolase [Clostridium sp.]MCM1547720.1 serine hydrolase [Ruminococcus sp.]